MTRKRKPKHPEVSALRSPPQARTGLAKWPRIVDETPDDQAAQVEIAPRFGTARAPIEDREPAPARQRTPADRDPEDADVRAGQLDGRPLLDSRFAQRLATSRVTIRMRKRCFHEMERAMIRTKDRGWSLTSLQQRLFKTGGRLIRHARYFILQVAESHLTRTLFRQILGRIERLAWHPT